MPDSDAWVLEHEPAFGVAFLRVAESEDEFVAVQVFARNHFAMMIDKLVFKKSAKIGEAGDPIFGAFSVLFFLFARLDFLEPLALQRER